ncbi:MAG TPA: MASE3 domain-containing protein, partial [Dongiaceae bacterium]|nr:MASE3 domain-containing protein [Dongiaceae bacterium]
MATVLATNQRVESEKSTVTHAVAILLIAYVMVSIWLLAAGTRDYPILHTILDTGVGLTAAVLAALLWVMGRHVGVPFLTWLATAFGGAALLQLVHVLVVVEWPGGSVTAPSAQALQAATWGPGAYLLPIAIGGSLWMFAAKKGNTIGFAIAVLITAVALFAIFQWLPPQTAQTHFGVTRPALLVAPLL